MRHARSRDANEPAIVAALKKAGASVQATYGTSGEPDLLVGYEGETYLLEVKNPERNRTRGRSKATANATLLRDEVDEGGEFEGMSPLLSRRQARWHKAWKGRPVAIVETPCEALTAIGAPCPCAVCLADEVLP